MLGRRKGSSFKEWQKYFYNIFLHDTTALRSYPLLCYIILTYCSTYNLGWDSSLAELSVSVCLPSASGERGNTDPARFGSWGQQVSFIIQNCFLTFYLLGQRMLYSSWLNFLMMKQLSCQIIKLLLPSTEQYDFLLPYLAI